MEFCNALGTRLLRNSKELHPAILARNETLTSEANLCCDPLCNALRGGRTEHLDVTELGVGFNAGPNQSNLGQTQHDGITRPSKEFQRLGDRNLRGEQWVSVLLAKDASFSQSCPHVLRSLHLQPLFDQNHHKRVHGPARRLRRDVAG